MRAKDLTQQLLTFARGGVPIRKPLQVSKLIKDTAQFALNGSNVEGEFALSNELWMVEVDEGQFRQLMHNLVVNAMQAMPDGGKADVRAENVELASGAMPPLNAGKYVKISIRDFGTGIRPEHMQRVFDPYFTTKKHSSGLGLASAYSIVRKHEGQIQVESTYGAGSTFQIYLPAYLKPIAPIVTETGQSQFFGRGKILVMDDESEILMVLEGMLKAMGYEVDVAKDGTEALERYIAAKKNAQPFSAVIMDLTIPNGMGGKEAIRHLKEVDPEVKAIVSSGYSYDPVMASFQQFGFSGVIPKPYVMDDLGRVLKEVLGDRTGAANRN
jgi:CheY-like chemotaxis protein